MMTQAQKTPRARAIARIWCLAKDIALTDELLHCLVRGVTGQDSIRLLSSFQMSQVIRELESLRRRQLREKRKKARERRGVICLATPQQRRRAEEILAAITPLCSIQNPQIWLNAVCLRTYGKPYARLLKDDMQKLIETLKQIQKRTEGENND